MCDGRTVRMGRVFAADGRALVVAMDHLVVLESPEPGLADIVGLVRQVRDGGADAIIATRGVLTQAARQLRGLPVVLSVPLGGDSPHHVPETAVRLGADMVKVLAYPFTSGFSTAAAEISALASACERWGLPLMVETVPGGFDAGPEMRTADRLTAAARIAVELGASAVKTSVPELSGGGVDLVGAKLLASYVPVPVVVLGGRPVARHEVITRAEAIVQSGLAGLAVGRNVWTREAGQVVRALRDVVHPR